MTIRWSLAGRPTAGFWGGRRGESRAHWASVSPLLTAASRYRGEAGANVVQGWSQPRRVRAPEDARATLVFFTDEGWRFLEDAYHVKRKIEAEYAAVLGEERMGLLRSALEELLEHEEKAGG